MCALITEYLFEPGVAAKSKDTGGRSAGIFSYKYAVYGEAMNMRFMAKL